MKKRRITEKRLRDETGHAARALGRGHDVPRRGRADRQPRPGARLPQRPRIPTDHRREHATILPQGSAMQTSKTRSHDHLTMR